VLQHLQGVLAGRGLLDLEALLAQRVPEHDTQLWIVVDH
jgi:hypothetical protein